jgi:ribosomal subunit interface protein
MKQEGYQINVLVKNFPATEMLMEYVRKRLGDLDKFSNMVQHLDVHLEEERGLYKGVGILKIKGKTIRVEVKGKDPMSAIDEMKDLLSREVKKEKDKVSKERRRDREVD